MSLFLRRISKLSLTKKPVSSCFSTATTSRSKPYLLLGNFYDFFIQTKNEENVLKFDLYDPTENKEVFKNLEIQDQSRTLRNLFRESQTIGSSRGYLVLRNRKDSNVNLIDISNQLNPKIISLPPLHYVNGEMPIKNVSVSSPVNGDVIVTVKFYGSKLSLCRVGDSEWTRIDVPCPNFEYSDVMYSERDERFYLNNGDWDCTGLIDFTRKSGLVTPPVIGYPFPISNIAEFKKYVIDLPHPMVEKHIVESPSGQLFLVRRFSCEFNKESKTQKIVVYKQDEEEEICSYNVTKDIGDLCIFIGRNEAFCVSASEYPGLKPNSVYFAGLYSDFGVCDLSSQTILHFSDKLTSQPYCRVFWIPPTPTLES